MTFFVFICILLRVLKYELDSSLIFASRATKEEIQDKQEEAEQIRSLLDTKGRVREEINDAHSTAGDNDERERERELGEQLEEIDAEIEDLWEALKELLEFLAG